MAKKKPEKIAEELVEEVLDLIGVKAKFKVEIEEPDQKTTGPAQDYKYIKVSIEGDDLGVLIGYHGKNLRSLQYIVGLILRNKFEEDDKYRVVIDVNGYREEMAERIRKYATTKIEELRETGEELEFPPMKPDERRVVHMMVKEIDDIESASVGEGRERRVKLTLKNEK